LNRREGEGVTRNDPDSKEGRGREKKLVCETLRPLDQHLEPAESEEGQIVVEE
jgi:hypothetical protein